MLPQLVFPRGTCVSPLTVCPPQVHYSSYLAEFICPILKPKSRPFSGPTVPFLSFLLNKNQSSSGEGSLTSLLVCILIFIALSLELNAQSSAVKLIDSGYSHRDLRIVSIVTEILSLYKFNLPYLRIIIKCMVN